MARDLQQPRHCDPSEQYRHEQPSGRNLQWHHDLEWLQNLSSDGTCNFNNSGDLNNTDPKLGPLQNNGGPTQTQALCPVSPAIDAGNPNGCTDGNGHLLRADQPGARQMD
jgi:hypothetical protein